MQKTVHFILQGKGGVGKSFIASNIAQFLIQSGETVNCYDTDPVNQTFGRYDALNVQSINILNEHQQIDSSVFDKLIEDFFAKDGIAVIDNGAATFVPLMSYLRESNIIDMLNESGIKVIVHVPIVGGQAMEDTLMGLNAVISELHCEVIVWINNYWGDVQLENRSFEDLKVYKNHADKITTVIRLKNYNPDTFGKDIREMTSKHLTYEQYLNSEKYTLMPKQRIKMVRTDIFTQLLQAPLLLSS